MKFRVLALAVCACLLIFTLASCGIKLSPDTAASPDASGSIPSSSPGAAPVGDGTEVKTVTGVVDKISAGTVTLKVTKPYDAAAGSGQEASPAPGLVGSGSYLYILQGETQTFTVSAGTIVILEDQGYVPGLISDIMPGDFLAAALSGDAAVAVVDNGQANVITSPPSGGESSPSPSPSDGGDMEAVQPSPSGSMTPAPSTSPSGSGDSSSGTTYTVTTDNLKVRSGPGTTYDIIGQLSMGTKLTGTVTDGWLKFIYNDKTAYCMASYLKSSTGGTATSSSSSPAPSSSPGTGTEKTYKVTEADLKIRSGPGTTYDILGKFALGDKVTGVVVNGWLKFDYNGKTAYCKAEYLTLAN